MATQETPEFYGNIVQVSRTPWDVTLHFLKVQVPTGLKSGTRINAMEHAERVVTVTLPKDVAEKLIGVLGSVVSGEYLKQEGETSHDDADDRRT
jgi:hypothetical protein